jgi:hypothetical protein
MSGQIGMSTRISVICPVQGHVADMSRANETKCIWLLVGRIFAEKLGKKSQFQHQRSWHCYPTRHNPQSQQEPHRTLDYHHIMDPLRHDEQDEQDEQLCIIAVGQDDFCLKVGQELPVSCCLS